jgi:hypothetical protein
VGLGHDLAAIYGKHCSTPARKERMFLTTLGFFNTFAATRLVTHAIRGQKGPFRNVNVGGRHVHHMTFGILGLLLCGFLWANEIGMGDGRAHRVASQGTSLLYGAGAALTLDEFALWLNLADDYWTSQGRESIDAVALFGSALLLCVLGRDPIKEASALLARRSRDRVSAATA